MFTTCLVSTEFAALPLHLSVEERAWWRETPGVEPVFVGEAEAAKQLLAADAALRSEPTNGAARRARVEALIACRSYEQALTDCAEIECRSHAALLKSKALLWSGNLAGAEAVLRLPASVQPPPDENTRLRLLALGSFIQRLTAVLATARSEGCASALAIYAMLLASDAMVGETWMRATILRQRAAVYAVDRQVPAAQDDVTAALSISPDDVDALILQARLRAMSGEHERAFLDIRRLHILAPHRYAEFPSLQDAARSALHLNSNESVRPLPRFYRVLGVPLAATNRDIAQAFRKKSMAWHPDRWRADTTEKQELAQQRFCVVAEAYECLRDAERRAKYDQLYA